MCKASCSLYLWVLSIFTIAVALSCLTAGTVGDSWWYKDTKDVERHDGLWRNCRTTTKNNSEICENRNDILEFEDIENVDVKSKELDVSLLVMILSSAFSLLSLVSVLSMLFCQSTLASWKFGSLMTSLFTFISMVTSMAALIYVEKEFEDKFETYDHGWSIIIAWIGAGFALISFVVSFTLLSISERDFPENDLNYTKQNDSKGMADRGGAVTNKGYELQ